VSVEKHGPGIRTRVLLLISLSLIVAGTMASSLYVVRFKLRQRVQEILEGDLRHSLDTFQDLKAQRRSALENENMLLSMLPTLKALMTTHDQRTIADDSIDFWKLSGNDLFALADSEGRVITADAPGRQDTDDLKRDLQGVLPDPSIHYLLSAGKLYEYAQRPIYFGSAGSGTILGYVISGYAVDHRFLLEVGRGAGAEAMFLTRNVIAVSTLSSEQESELERHLVSFRSNSEMSATMGRERYLTIGRDLTDGGGVPLRLVVMKSFDQAESAEREINRLIFLAGMLSILPGVLMMWFLARMVTEPLESLARGVKAFGAGNLSYALPMGGTQEVRYLSKVFEEMRDEIQKKNKALLESERLATIGRMASSVSHDLRHYLAAVYANAEFLASPGIPLEERLELFEEIKLAVLGTTDMLDSLLIFGSTGTALRLVVTPMSSLVERTVALVRTHPDADRVSIQIEKTEGDTTASFDTSQVERAVYNLLLNACQSARESEGLREVTVLVSSQESTVSVSITDSGPGVAEGIRESLFEPFVSQGKQKGTGLGLTLASSVAREHGGNVELVHSRSGETMFRLTISRCVVRDSTMAPISNPAPTVVL
jgi:signal transduction histidine kinase